MKGMEVNKGKVLYQKCARNTKDTAAKYTDGWKKFTLTDGENATKCDKRKLQTHVIIKVSQ